MKTVKKLNRTIQEARKKAGIGLDAIAAHLGLESQSTISRKINGKTAWTYEEVVKIGELLNISNLAKDEVTPPAPDDPLAYIIAETLRHLSARDRSQMLSTMGWFLETKAKTRKEHAKVKILQRLARSAKTDFV